MENKEVIDQLTQGGQHTDQQDQPLEVRQREIQAILDEYLTRINAKIKPPERVDEALNLSYTDKKNLDSEQCGEYYDLLIRQSYYLQQEMNYNKGKLDWCEGTLSYFIANYWQGDNFTKREEKGAKLAINNTAVRTLLKMLYQAKTYVTSLEKLAERMEKIAESYKNLQYTKRKYQA